MNFEVTDFLAEAADKDGQEPHRTAIQVGLNVYPATTYTLSNAK